MEINLKQTLNTLIGQWENEVVEFKQAGNDYHTDKIGRYFSALSNEANLRDIEKSWLIFGINDKSKTVVGTDFRKDKERLQSFKMQISENSEPSVTMHNIFELETEKGRVVLFEIPPAPQGLPIAWKGHYYARSGESLTHLGIDKQDEIRNQSKNSDWSVKVIPEATIEHLDETAIKEARKAFTKKYSNRFDSTEIESWSDITFLNRAKICIDDKITRTAILLLGKSESAHFLNPYPAQITWKLEGEEKAYQHFGPPFFLNTTSIYQKIRNFQVRILPYNTLLPIEVSKYDQKIVLEAMHNCIAHQDYKRNGRIIVAEYNDKLTFENEGYFFEGKPEDYFFGEKTPRKYRNPFLAQAMAELNMIDTMGYGIHEIHKGQAKRYFPLPDYEFPDTNSVKMILYGKIVDHLYSKLLIERTDLSLSDIISLDKIQKKRIIDDEIIKNLRKAGLVEGRKPNIHISGKIAKITNKKAEYIKTKAQDDDYYAKLIFDYLTNFKSASREDINNLLWNKLSDLLDDNQKDSKIANLLTKLRRNDKIKNDGSRSTPKWIIAERNEK